MNAEVNSIDPRDEKREESSPSDDEPRQASGQALIRTVKSIVVRRDDEAMIDTAVVSPRFFNCFNYALMSRDAENASVIVGITSALPGEGKTLVAANIAVSMALANERATLLVDCNFRRPQVHAVFGTALSPGLAEGLMDPTIVVVPTMVKNLTLLTAGSPGRVGLGHDRQGRRGGSRTNGHLRGGAGLALPANFRDVIYSLQQNYEQIIIDMPPIFDPILPMSVIQQMHGLLVVVDSTRTTREDTSRVLDRVGHDRVLGFVLNKVPQ